MTPRAAVSEVAELPMQPSKELGPEVTLNTVCDGLRNNDFPTPDKGIERLYNFMTPQGLVKLAPVPPKSGLQGGVTLEYFLEHAAGPALGSLIYCHSTRLIGETRISPGSNTRGRIATVLLEVRNSPLEDDSNRMEALKALVSAPDDFLEAILAAKRNSTPLPSPPEGLLLKSRFWVQIEEQRRPPQQGAWLIKEFMPLAKTKFQELNEGGEEFEGDDN
jgi:hypothetical protein